MSNKSALGAIAADQPIPSFVCTRSDSVLAAIERCLDNGTETCFVVDDDNRLIGRLTLDDFRRAVADGRAIEDPTIGVLLDDMGLPGDNAPPGAADGVAVAVTDAEGRLRDVRVDRSRLFVQIAKPALSHHELRLLLDTFMSSWISGKGPRGEEFENAFARRIGVRYGVAVANGTVALHLALATLGIGPGDEVIVPDLTFAATINAVLHCGATPVIVDVGRRSWTMTAAAVARAVTARTRAVVPVHLYGRPAEIGPIRALADAHGFAVVEDCAEAHGARYAGETVGTFGDMSCFSFHANKLLTTGEGGMCLTSRATLHRRAQELRDHGMAADRPYWHEQVGYNYRLPGLQAALGLAQLARLDEAIARNRALEQSYHEHLRGIPGVSFPPPLPDTCEPVVWLVCVQVPAAAQEPLLEAACRAGIELRPFFHALSTMPLYRRYAPCCPNSAELSRTGLNLPTSYVVDACVIERVAAVFRRVLA